EERAVVVQAVHADLEASAVELAHEPHVDLVLRADDVEAGTETTLFFEVGQLEREAEARFAFDVVAEDERGLLSSRPKPGEGSFVETAFEQQAERIEAKQPVDAAIEGPAGKAWGFSDPHEHAPQRQPKLTRQ